jgi:hypothetical protein
MLFYYFILLAHTTRQTCSYSSRTHLMSEQILKKLDL